MTRARRCGLKDGIDVVTEQPKTGAEVFKAPPENQRTILSTDAKTRKNAPMHRGLLRYFPKALAAVAEVSRIGNEQHNPGEPMHWARGKSDDHGDCIVRHQAEAGTIDTDGQRHSAKVAWRALAQLELEIEAAERGE